VTDQVSEVILEEIIWNFTDDVRCTVLHDTFTLFQRHQTLLYKTGPMQ